MSSFGISSAGFRPKQQAQIITEMQQSFAQGFGNNVNVSDSSVFGQLIAIFSEREALLWQLAEDIRSSATAEGATGLDVDNLLALANLTRLPARASVTNPTPSVQTNGIPLYGLVLFGAPGTVIPAGSLISDGRAIANQYTLDAAVTIAAAQNARQSLFFSNTPTQGAYALTLADPTGALLTTASIPYNAQPQSVAVTKNINQTGVDPGFYLQLDGQKTATLPIVAAPADIQAAVQALSNYSSATVSGTASSFFLSFGSARVPKVQFFFASTSNPTFSMELPANVSNSVQGAINNLTNPQTTLRPFSDVVVSSTGNGLVFSFGATSPADGQPSTAGTAQPAITIASNTLSASTSVTNLTVQQGVVGAPAQGIGSATCTATGPVSDVAGSLSTIVSALSGWTGVTNQLDVLQGRDVESDADAVTRFQGLKNTAGAASLAAITARIQAVSGVTSVLSFVNASDAAQQVLYFTTPPTGGAYALAVGGQTTASLAYNASVTQVQTAIRNLSGFGGARVTGSASSAFILDFSQVQGGQPQPLVTVASDTTAAGLSVRYGRPAHSVEMVVTGGSDVDVGNALLSSVAAGIATYGTPLAVTTGSISAGTYTLTVASTAGVAMGQSVTMKTASQGTKVVSLSGSTVTLSNPAISDASNVSVVFDNRLLLADAAGNLQTVNFSRPTSRLVYVNLALVVDQYVVPGDATSGANPNSQFNPAEVRVIQQDIMDSVNVLTPGATISAKGTNGLFGSFREQKGVVDWTLTFGLVPNPTNTADITLGASESPLLNLANIQVSYK